MSFSFSGNFSALAGDGVAFVMYPDRGRFAFDGVGLPDESLPEVEERRMVLERTAGERYRCPQRNGKPKLLQ